MNRATRTAFTVAAALTVAAVVMGTVVCATESGAACPNWPGCYPGQFAPEAALNPMIEFVHRVVAALAGPAVLVAAWLGRRVPEPAPRRLAWLALAGTLSAGVFGMLIVRVGIPWWLGVLDLASALVACAAMLLGRVLLTGAWRPGGTARLAWTGLGALAVLHLSALAVAGPNSFTRCLSWPLGVLAADRWPVLQGLRIALAVVAAGLIVVAAGRAVATARSRSAGWLVLALLAAEGALGAALLVGVGGSGVRTGYAVTAALLFAAVALLAARTSVPAASSRPVGEPVPPAGLTAEYPPR